MVANYAEHTLVTFHGVLGDSSTSDQTWSFGLRVDINQLQWAGHLAIDPDAWANFLNTCLTGFAGSILPETLTNSVFLFGAKGVIIGNDGHYIDLPHEDDYDLLVAYGTGASWKPFQVALVGTLRHVALGRGNYGRIYLPCPNTTPARNGHITSVQAGVWADALNNFIHAVNLAAATVVGTSDGVCIYSRTAATKKKVDQVGVGSVMDTQRRRRDQLVEAIEYRDVA